MASSITVTRADVLRFRFQRHQLDREPASAKRITDVDFLHYGVQDTGNDGSLWALALRGARVDSTTTDDALFIAWTLRGAPHAYRRADVEAIAAATAPFSDADAAKRIFDASKPLKAAGIAPLDALRTVAKEMRTIATKPVVKGDMSGALTTTLDAPFLRFCRPCNATHIYEQPFRLSALQAGLELEPGTSPPVLHRIKGFKPPLFSNNPSDTNERFDVVRNYVRFFGPARVADATAFIDAASKDVKARWPEDVVEVEIDDVPSREKRWILASDFDALKSAATSTARGVVRLLAPHDPYLQLRDRDVLVDSETRRKDLWRVIGRPGAVVVDGEVVASWRPKSSGNALTINVEPWTELTRRTVDEITAQAERLATHRGVTLKAVAGLR